MIHRTLIRNSAAAIRLKKLATIDATSLDPEELLNSFVYDQMILDELSQVEVGPIETKMVGDYPAASMEITFDYGTQPGKLYIVLYG